jgi:uncharacterized membrane protein YhhN
MTPASYIWFPPLIAIIDWIAVFFRWRLLGYLTKPGVMIALLIWLWIASDLSGQLLLIGFALLFSLLGDIFLMLPRKLFLYAIISFSLVHIIYITALNLTFPPINLVVLILISIIAYITIRIAKRLVVGLKAQQMKQMIPFICIYMILISMMLLSAILTLIRPDWEIIPALLLSAGALLFFVSDTILAFHNFVFPINYGELKIRVSYHLGQIAIVIGFFHQFMT